MRIPVPRLLLAVLAASAAGGACAGIYKCADEGNKPIYQDSPCPPGKELRNFDTDPAEVSVIPHEVFIDPARPVAPKPATPSAPVRSDKKKEAAAGADVGQRRFIVAGMSEAEVVAKIGAPDMTSGVKGRKSSRWSYLPAPGDPQTITTLVFDSGKVVDVERKVMR
jgi:Domain of unknown function (DUF4124)